MSAGHDDDAHSFPTGTIQPTDAFAGTRIDAPSH